MYKNKFLKVAAATPKMVLADVEFNKNEILKTLSEIDAKMVVFPELSLTGYNANDLFFQEAFIKKVEAALYEIMTSTKFRGIYIIGAPIEVYGILYNCGIIFQDNNVLGVVPKHYLPNYHEFYEKRWFHTGYNTKLKEIDLFNRKVPFGNLLFESKDKNIRFGVEVCQDLWAPYSPSDDMGLNGANLIFNLSASSEEVLKNDVRRSLVKDHSRKQTGAYVYTTTGYYESISEALFSGHKIICELGKIIAEDTKYHDGVITADIDLTKINYHKRMDSTYRDMHPYAYNQYQTIKFELAEDKDYVFTKQIPKSPFLAGDSTQILFEAKEILINALMQKIIRLKNHNNVVIGVSGGLDSTLSLLIAVEAYKRLNKDLKELYTITLPTKNNPKSSLDRAYSLINNLGTKHIDINIDEDVNRHLQEIEHDKKDFTYENAQARIRTLYLMDLANKYNGFVLGTGDLSEIALGFMTYNADQTSMYHIIQGVPKTVVKALVEHFSNNEFGSIKSLLEDINKQIISPELLENQNTEELIGSYLINDFILYYHLNSGHDKENIKWLLTKTFELTDAEANVYVERFFTKFYNNQFKRQTMPEGPKVFSVSLSPRAQFKLPSDVSVK